MRRASKTSQMEVVPLMRKARSIKQAISEVIFFLERIALHQEGSNKMKILNSGSMTYSNC